MKYVYTTILTLALMALPMLASASHGERREMIPIDQYVVIQIDRFTTYVQQPNRSAAELSEAIADLTTVLSAYVRTLE
ncbi:MAG: hypothetical protein WD335_03815 [Candidatus Paceibacterota bacterium]